MSTPGVSLAPQRASGEGKLISQDYGAISFPLVDDHLAAFTSCCVFSKLGFRARREKSLPTLLVDRKKKCLCHTSVGGIFVHLFTDNYLTRTLGTKNIRRFLHKESLVCGTRVSERACGIKLSSSIDIARVNIFVYVQGLHVLNVLFLN